MNSVVLNNSFGSPYVFGNPTLPRDEEISLLASLFEQLMIFDKITLTTSRLNFALTFLINKLGINTVETMLDRDYLNFILWSPIIVSGSGLKRDDGTMDESVIYGQPPIVAGTLTESDLDPEKNIKTALDQFPLHRDRKRTFIRKAVSRYTVPDGMLFSKDAAELVIDAYKNNNLESLGLPYVKEPNQLDIDERGRLLDLSQKVTETAILSKYGLKSYENYEAYEICKKNLENIGKGYNMAANTSNLFKLENLPDLKKLFITERLDFESVFKLRHLSTAKYYRHWINEVGENSNMDEVSREYIKEIKGKGGFAESSTGKWLKVLLVLGAHVGLAHAIGGEEGELIAGGSLGIMETFLLESILKGKNPAMFIDAIRQETTPEATLSPALLEQLRR
jgi:hypothetical protein